MTQKDIVVLKTSMGEIEIELYPEKAPVSVQNFVRYIGDGYYDNTIFHRVIRNFMIQGGGYDARGVQKETRDPIVNEAANGLKNLRGTLAYARTNQINSATSQFFINHRDNPNLDFQDSTQTGFGYAVFGRVLRGMDVVDAIAAVPTGRKNLSIRHQGGMYDQPHQDVPVTPVVIKSVKYHPAGKE
ncbi:MAG TPA: peptidylprolyl isomerase A [bacterium]|nr:peptidylprolyl isomerase A [bacterium]